QPLVTVTYPTRRSSDLLDDGQSEINTPLSGIQPGVPHHWKIIWKVDNSIEFWVDDVLKATHTRTFTVPLNIYLSAGQTATADWIRVTSTSPTPTQTLRHAFTANSLDSSTSTAAH